MGDGGCCGRFFENGGGMGVVLVFSENGDILIFKLKIPILKILILI